MNTAILFELNPSAGGSFSYSFDTCVDIIKRERTKKIKLYCFHKSSIKYFKKKGIQAEYLSLSFIEKNVMRLLSFKIFRILIAKTFISFPIEHKLLKKNIKNILYPTLSKSVFFFKKINFFSTVLDLCHIYHNRNFPEISKNEFSLKEDIHRYSFKRSLKIITNSEEIRSQINTRYKFKKKNIIILPFLPKNMNNSNIKSEIIKKKYSKYKRYLFYPAHLWSHKNHKIIIDAANYIKKNNLNIYFLFSGIDKGNKTSLLNKIQHFGLKNIIFLNFIEEKEIRYLYMNCLGVIMTSYFGPTNLPPLEAWFFNKPIIYNKSFQNELGKNTCEFVNVDDYKDVARSIVKVANNRYSKTKLIKAKKKLLKINQNYRNKLNDLVNYL